MIGRVGLQDNFDFNVIQVIGEDAESELVVQRHTMAIYRAKKQIRRQEGFISIANGYLVGKLCWRLADQSQIKHCEANRLGNQPEE